MNQGKKINHFALCLVIAMTICLPALAQNSCCSATESFAALADASEFHDAHLTPEPFLLTDPIGKAVSISINPNVQTTFYAIEAQVESDAYVLVFHEWWGLNTHIKSECDKIFKALGGKAHIIAVDLYKGQVATEAGEAARYMQSVQQADARAIIAAVIDYCGPNAKICSIGWCMGGGWSLQASLIAQSNAAACIMYYGMPETDVAILKTLHAPVLGIFASQDKWINSEVVKTFQNNMMSAEKTLELKIYNADHAFANPSNPKHNENATQNAFDVVVEFMKTHLAL